METGVGAAVGGAVGIVVGLLPFWLWPATFLWSVTCTAGGHQVPCQEWQSSVGRAVLNFLVLFGLAAAGFVAGPIAGATAGVWAALRLAGRPRVEHTTMLALPLTLIWLVANWGAAAVVKERAPLPVTWMLPVVTGGRQGLATLTPTDWLLLALGAAVITTIPAIAARALTHPLR